MNAPASQLGCPICGATTQMLLAFRKNDIDIFRCSACGVGRALVDHFSPEFLYTEGYFAGEQEGAYLDYAGSETVLRRDFARQARFLDRFAAGPKLLEIGCAYGFFLQEAARRGYEVHGVEMARAAVDHCGAAGLATVDQGELSEDYLDRYGPFDAVVLLDVIEHIDDVRGTMAMAARHMRKGGVLMLTTGDWNSLLARVAGASWRLVAPPLHLWYFTPAALETMFAAIGLRLVHRSHPWKLVPLDLILDQAAMMIGLKAPRLPSLLGHLGLPANLFDAMRLVFRKT